MSSARHDSGDCGPRCPICMELDDQERILVDPDELCPASGLTNRECMASICDCFPDEVDRFGIHPERFVVGGDP